MNQSAILPDPEKIIKALTYQESAPLLTTDIAKVQHDAIRAFCDEVSRRLIEATGMASGTINQLRRELGI